jgi:thioesterase domain-containing protein
MGGVVAYEMAAQWTGLAPRLALLDSPPPVGYSQSAVGQDDYHLFAATVCADSDLDISVGGLRIQPHDDELGARVLAACLAAGGVAVPADVLRTRWEVYRRHRGMTGAYVAECRLSTSALVVAAELTDQQLDQWDERFEVAPRRLRAADDHFGVLRDPGVVEVAAAIENLAEAVPTGPGRSFQRKVND